MPILFCLLPQFTSHDWKAVKVANNLGMVQLQHNLGQKLFYQNACRLLQRGNLQPCTEPHTWPRNIFSPQKKTATPRFFFQISQHLAISTASVAATVILCVIQKYEMQDGSRGNPAHRAKLTRAENTTLDELFALERACEHGDCSATWRSQRITRKLVCHPALPAITCPASSLLLQGDCGGLLTINTRLGKERNRRVEGTEPARFFHRSFTEHLMANWVSLEKERPTQSLMADPDSAW